MRTGNCKNPPYPVRPVGSSWRVAIIHYRIPAIIHSTWDKKVKRVQSTGYCSIANCLAIKREWFHPALPNLSWSDHLGSVWLRRIVNKNVKKIATGTPVNPPLPQATPPSTANSSSTATSPSTATSSGTASSSTTALSSTATLSGTTTRSSTSVAPAEPASPTTAMATEMCDRAMQMMDRIGRFLDKYESETSESE